MDFGFPEDDFTPYGYLDNPFDSGPWVGLEAGGVLRSSDGCGFEWFHPDRDPPASGGLLVGVEVAGEAVVDFEGFRRLGIEVVSRHHTSRCHSFDLEVGGRSVSLAFILASRDALLCRMVVESEGRGTVPLLCRLVVPRGARRNGRAEVLLEGPAIISHAEPGPWYALVTSLPAEGKALYADGQRLTETRHLVGEAYSHVSGILVGEIRLEREERVEAWGAVGRGPTPARALAAGQQALEDGAQLLRARLEEDRRFWQDAPRLVGDWPASWRRGWVYDLETTRLMVRPPAGVFGDVWPSWQLFHPRIVLAENVLDMMRLGLADPQLARKALTTVLQDAPEANVPCIFPSGSLNMVAEGGEPCGTSPAWCLPFHSLYLLYLWDPDPDWLRSVYPRLADYLRWWLRHRCDEEGWIVYRCTWESGEDATPRLDPERTGHRDIFGEIRPVELQACMAHSAWLLARFGEILGLDDEEVDEWREIYEHYRDRTRSLWDPSTGRFRDQAVDSQWAAAPTDYWGGAGERSPLELTPLLYQVATSEQERQSAEHLRKFVGPPYTWWPSWTYTVAEAARAAGEHRIAGELVAGILARVYPLLDGRSGAGPRPGTSSEWWPEDLDQASVRNETYGWGATTATLLLRHLLGFGPSQHLDGLVFELAPSLPGELLEPGRTYGVANLTYRGGTLDLHLETGHRAGLTARLRTAGAKGASVRGPGGEDQAVREGGDLSFRVENHQTHLIRVDLEDGGR